MHVSRRRAVAMRVSSMMQLCKNFLTEEDFRTHIRAHGVLRRVVAMIGDAPEVPEIMIPACATVLVLHLHAHRSDGDLNTVKLLLQLLTAGRKSDLTGGRPGARVGGGAKKSVVHYVSVEHICK